MLVKEVSGKELREFHGQSKMVVGRINNSPQEALSDNSTVTPLTKCKRVADLISNSPQEAPSNNSPATPLINVEVKRPRLEVSNSPPVLIPRSSPPSSSKGVDEMWTSFFPEIKSSRDGNETSVCDEIFPFGDLIDKHFSKEKFSEKFKEMELERVLQTSLTDSVRTTFHLCVMGQKLGDTVKENKAYVGEIAELKKIMTENEKNYVGEITELKNKLSEYEKNMVEMTSLKDELNKLKKTLEYSSLEKNRMIAREKDLMDENSKNKVKLLVNEDAHKVIVNKLKAEIEELKGKISLQYKAGYDKAVRQVVYFASGLKP